MITGNECGPNFLTFVLRLRGENLNQETDPTGDCIQVHCVRGTLDYTVIFVHKNGEYRRKMSGNLGLNRPRLSRGRHISSKSYIIRLRMTTVSDLSCSTWPLLNNKKKNNSFLRRKVSIGRESPHITWPARSQDLTPLDFFSCGGSRL